MLRWTEHACYVNIQLLQTLDTCEHLKDRKCARIKKKKKSVHFNVLYQGASPFANRPRSRRDTAPRAEPGLPAASSLKVNGTSLVGIMRVSDLPVTSHCHVLRRPNDTRSVKMMLLVGVLFVSRSPAFPQMFTASWMP